MSSNSSDSSSRLSARNTLKDAWLSRRVWWFTATSRTQARFVRTSLGSFWLGLSNLFSIAVLAAVYGTVFKVQNFTVYVVYLGLGLVVWNTLSSAISGAPNLFEQSRTHLHNINLHPIFFTLEEWSFQLQTFLQSFILVLFALSFFQHNLFLNLLIFGWLPLLNFCIFLYWFPVLICLLGARFRDLYQLVPIVLQLVFLLSPILYQKKNLGAMSWTANINPLYRILSPIRHTLMSGQVQWGVGLFLLIFNICGVWFAIFLLNRERRHLPFLV
ncbi:ABC transporter permease [Synechococcus sp. GEYO]|uniref:ABC transporter permease n=1 Tax=Synechococcus sp. GEYO TaxID=2575511 RepID=UPI001FCA7088|nr:ABC transporter permease [Synechococcus sp. GEYO]